MLIPRIVVWSFLVGILVLGMGAASGQQNFPNKPVRIVTSGIGGGNDFTARLLAQGLTVNMGQQIVVHNRPSGLIPGQDVSRALPDGYTMLLAGGAFMIGTLLVSNPPYDPVRDFSPVSLVDYAPNVLVVHPSVPVNSVTELIALAKAKPGALNYASSGSGGSTHLAAELFKAMAGVDITRVPYKDGATQMADLVGGRVQLSFASPPSVAPHTRSGKLRALAITSKQPSALAPGVPTVTATGLPGYESISIDAMYVPAKTPNAIINRLNQELVRVLNRADVREKLLNAGLEVVGSSPAQLATAVKSEMAKWGKLVKDLGLTTN